MAQPIPASPAASVDPTQGDPSQGQTPDMSNGYEITIKVDADQNITVSVEPSEPDDSDASGDGSGGDDDEDSQSVPSIKAACQVVTDIFKNAGQMTDGGAEQDAMAGGYGAGGGQ